MSNAYHTLKDGIPLNKTEDKMSTFKNIEKLGLKVIDLKGIPYCVDALALEDIFQSAQVVYGVWDKNGCRFAESQFPGHTHTAMLLNITSIKKKTKAEAALELLERLESMSGIFNVSWPKDDMKRILEMKD